MGAIAADRPIDDEVIFDCARRKLAIVAAGRARRRPPPGAQPRPHGRARDRDGDRVPALPPRRGGRRSACWRRSSSPGRASCARGSRSCSPRTACRRAPTGSTRRPWSRATRATRSASATDVPFVLVDAPGAVRHGAQVSRRAARGRARGNLPMSPVRNRVARAARGQHGHARPARPGALRHAHARASSSSASRRSRASSGSR